MPDTPDPTQLTDAAPATVFLSYQRDDAAAVERIERGLRLRGIRVMRDETALRLGKDNVQGLTDLIAHYCDAIIFYVTPRMLESDFIWRYEVPAALDRWRCDRRFQIIPVVQGLAFSDIALFCADKGMKALSDFNAARIVGKMPSLREVTKTARRALDAAFGLRIGRSAAPDAPLAVCVRTFPYSPPTPTLHLDVDWSAAFVGKGPTPTAYARELFPALRDVAQTIATMGGGLAVDLWLKARLPVGVAVGYAFPLKGSVRVRLCDEHSAWHSDGEHAAAPPLAISPLRLNPDDSGATIEVAINRAIFDDVAAWRKASGPIGADYVPKWRVQCIPSGGITANALPDDTSARTASRQIGDAVHRLWDRERVADIHLFLAGPVKFAAMVGQHLRDRRRVHVYYGDNVRGYRLAYTLDPEIWQ